MLWGDFWEGCYSWAEGSAHLSQAGIVYAINHGHEAWWVDQGVHPKQAGRMPRALDAQCHLLVPNIRLCHPLVGYVQSFTTPSVSSCTRTSEGTLGVRVFSFTAHRWLKFLALASLFSYIFFSQRTKPHECTQKIPTKKKEPNKPQINTIPPNKDTPKKTTSCKLSTKQQWRNTKIMSMYAGRRYESMSTLSFYVCIYALYMYYSAKLYQFSKGRN